MAARSQGPKGWHAKTIGEGEAERLQHWCPKCWRPMKPIPIAAAERIADAYGYDQVVIIARRVGAAPEPHGEYVTTYGVDREHCASAAAQGRALKRFMGWPEEKLCQVPDCGKAATYHSFPANAVHPDEGGMQTCDGHLSEGMSVLAGQPTPDHWRVFPIHEASPPYCAVTCPTCHPSKA